jgi:hypothetical protein
MVNRSDLTKTEQFKIFLRYLRLRTRRARKAAAVCVRWLAAFDALLRISHMP